MASQDPQFEDPDIAPLFQITYIAELEGCLSCRSTKQDDNLHHVPIGDYLVLCKRGHSTELTGLRIVGWKQILNHYLMLPTSYPNIRLNVTCDAPLQTIVQMARIYQARMDEKPLVGSKALDYEDAEQFARNRNLSVPHDVWSKALSCRHGSTESVSRSVRT